LAGFNQELARRLETLDQGKNVLPEDAQARLKRKSERLSLRGPYREEALKV
jgi:hypothetical protein